MNRRGVFATLAVLIAGLFAVMSSSEAQAGPGPRSGGIKGMVVTSSVVRDLAGQVVLEDSRHNALARTTISARGEFRFGDVALGEYIVVATVGSSTSNRMMQGRAAVRVAAGQISNVRIIVR